MRHATARRGVLFALLLLAAPCRAESLIELYRRALENNPGLKQYELEIDRREAQGDQTLSRLLPQVSVIASRFNTDFHQQSTDHDRYFADRASVQARQALFDLPSYRRLEAARARTSQSKDQWAAARLDLAEELIDRYLEALGASDDVANLQAERRSAEGQVARLRRMHERQLAKVTDLYEVEAYYQTLTARIIERENRKAVALEKLHETAGVVVRDVAPLTRETFPPVSADADHWVQEAMRNNQNLTALKYAIEAEEKTIASARAEHLPQVALVAGETYANVDNDNRLNRPYNVGTVGLQVSVSLYEGGRVQASVREALVRRDIAREQYEQRWRQIEREVRTAYFDTMSSLALIDATTQAVRAQERTRDSQQRSYELGASTIVDFLDAQRRLLQARTDQSRARQDFIRSFSTLLIRAGTLSDRDMEEINSWFATNSGASDKS